MASEHTRNAVWQDMIDINRLVRYYHALADRYQRKRNILRLVLFAAATGSVTAFFELLPEIVYPISSGIIPLCIALDFAQDYSTKTAVLRSVTHDCQSLEIEWQTLWNRQAQLNDNEIIQQNTQLSQRLNMIAEKTDSIGIRENTALNEKCTDDAYQIMSDYYGGLRRAG